MIKVLPGSGGAKYVEATTVARLLDEAFGRTWSFDIEEQWITEVGDWDILYNVRGTLYIGETCKTALASSSLKTSAVYAKAKEKKVSELEWADYINGNFEQLWKQTGTDCFKKCASLVGVAQELYGKTPAETTGPLHPSDTPTPAQMQLVKKILKDKWGLSTTDPDKAIELDNIIKSLGYGRSWSDITRQNVTQFLLDADEYLTDLDENLAKTIEGWVPGSMFK
jgi:hypothetical protein